LSTMKSMAIPINGRCFFILSGARPVLPMVVAPEAIVKSFLSIGSSVLLSQLHRSYIDFVECATSAPDGSSPRGYSQKKLFRYRLKYILLLVHILQDIYCFLLFCRVVDLCSWWK
jgi:hypothetical protein